MKDNVIHLEALQPSLRRSEDWAPGSRPALYAPGFVNFGELCSLACAITLRHVAQHGSCTEFPGSVRKELERWAHESIRGLLSIYVSSTGFVSIEARDDWAIFRYEVALNPAWLRQGYGSLK